MNEGVSCVKKRMLWLAVCIVMIVSVIAAPFSAVASSSVYKIYKTSKNANLRDKSDYTKIVTFLKKGAKVLWKGSVNKKNKKFLYVYTADGKEGYVYLDNLSEYGAVSKNKLYKAKSKATVYKKASTKSKSVTSVKKGGYLLVYEIKGNWAYVKTASGKGGYVQVSKLKK